MYLLITPVRNEEDFLPIIAESVINQSIKPKIWLIVNDGSQDNTPEIIENLHEKNPWIISLNLPPHPRDLFFHYSYVCKNGFDYVIERAEKDKIEYSYIGLLDADTKLEEKYFETLIGHCKMDEHLGIVSGRILDTINGKVKKSDTSFLPRGTGRLWTKKCFIDTDGYLVEAAAHSISNVKATLRGYNLKKIDEANGE